MKIVDQTYNCQVSGQVFGSWDLQCRLRIFQPHPEIQTVVTTNLGLMMQWFIPYRVEPLIEQVVYEFNLEPVQLIWIEHYTPNFKKPTVADFSQITVAWCNDKATHPQWTAISPQMAQALVRGCRHPVVETVYRHHHGG